MNTRIHLSLLTLSLAMLVACGGGNNNSLEAKRNELKQKKATLLTLNQEIQKLEADIAALDPSLAQKVKQVSVSITPLQAKDFSHFVSVQGKVESNRSADIGSQTLGTVKAVYVREGQQVKAGQVLAQLDDAAMRTTLQEIETSYDLAVTLFEKQERLWKQEIGTEVQFLQAKNQKESIERRIATMKEQLEMYKVKAPFAGVVDYAGPKVGETLSPGMPAFRIVNSGDLSLKADLSESYVPFIKRGDKVKVDFEALGKSYNATISVVGQTINPASRTFPVEVKLPNDPMLKPNLFGSIAINDRIVKNAITIPLSVVQNSEIGNFVYLAVKNENGEWTARRQPIELGLNSNGEVEAKSGLKSGDLLITAGYKDLSDGQQLIVTEPATKATASN